MATITVKNIPEEIYQRLKTLAKLRHRSLNSEIIYNLEKSIGPAAPDPEKLRKQIEEFRTQIGKKAH